MVALPFSFRNHGKTFAGRFKDFHFGKAYCDARQIIIKKVPRRIKQFTPTLAEHTMLTERGIPYRRRLLGERSHRSRLSWGKPSIWRRVTGLEASEREGMRDAVNRPEWMSRSRKRYTLKGVRTVW